MLCPRRCGTDRRERAGFCGAPAGAVVARTMLHLWEEPCISGMRGSGAVFFSGCNLRCTYCQNRDISVAIKGRRMTDEELAEEFLRPEREGAHNIDLITAAPYLPSVINALDIAKRNGLSIPVAYNTDGYEREEAIDALSPYVDVWLPHFKYASPALAAKYSHAADYPDIALRAIKRMCELAGPPVFGEDGMMKRGVVVRHLVLPGHRDDSKEVMKRLSEIGADRFILSLMRQYTPDFADESCDLRRRVTTFEYNDVLLFARELGLDGYMQSAESATSAYTPDFDRS